MENKQGKRSLCYESRKYKGDCLIRKYSETNQTANISRCAWLIFKIIRQDKAGHGRCVCSQYCVISVLCPGVQKWRGEERDHYLVICLKFLIWFPINRPLARQQNNWSLSSFREFRWIRCLLINLQQLAV